MFKGEEVAKSEKPLTPAGLGYGLRELHVLAKFAFQGGLPGDAFERFERPAGPR